MHSRRDPRYPRASVASLYQAAIANDSDDETYGHTKTIIDQPPPVPNSAVAVWDLVVEDMRERNDTGFRRYGTRLQPFNGRDPLVDAYQEALDLAVHLRQAIAERDA
jgi:hypothetical protein